MSTFVFLAAIAARALFTRDSLVANKAEMAGWTTYHANCDRCHGQDAQGSSFAPSLLHANGADGSMTHSVFVEKVTNGVVAKGMPAWSSVLRPDQIEEIWAYLQARSSGRLAPGRPHLASGG